MQECHRSSSGGETCPGTTAGPAPGAGTCTGASARRRPGSRVLGVIRGPQRVLRVLLREEAEDERHPDRDRDHRGQVRPLVALEERRLGGRRDLARVVRMLGGEVLGARVGELERGLRALGDVLARLGDRGPHRRRVAGGEERAEDRGHQRPAQVALQVGRSRGHADAGHGHRSRERVRGRRAREAHPDPEEACTGSRPASTGCPPSRTAASAGRRGRGTPAR